MSEALAGTESHEASLEARVSSPKTPSRRKADVFDQENFDAISYINEMFPTESSLVGLDPLIIKLRAKIRRLDTDILTAVRHQNNTGDKARQELDSAKSSIQDLFGKINDIRQKAEQSELMVQEICRDIKKLDLAKRHLTQSITALRRFAMLCNAVDQLQTATERGEYGEAAHLVEAVQQLCGHFQGYASIPKVAELNGRVTGLQMSLQISATREFDLLGTGEETPPDSVMERLRSCCALIDALGPKARHTVVDKVCRKEVGVYTQIFSGTGETAALDRTERRYIWLRNRLQKRAAVWDLFPESWKVQHLLCRMFSSQTRAQLAQSLDSKAAELSGSVEALLMAVKATNDFEADLNKRFGSAATQQTEDLEEEDASDDAASASAVRRRYEKIFKEKQQAENPVESPRSPTSQNQQENFQGSISSVFTKYLSTYVEAEERGLTQQLEGLMQEETWQPMEDAQQTSVLHSASNLFAIIKRSQQRCSKHISRGQALLQILSAFQRVLKAYAGKLYTRLPKTASGGTTGNSTATGAAWQIKVSDEEIEVVCTIVATAEYCSEVVGALGRSMAKTLEAPYNEQVDVHAEEDEFHSVITAGLSVLVLGIETRLDAPLQQMIRMPWSTMETVGDQSDFVNGVSHVISGVAPKLGAKLSELNFQYFCDKLAASFCQCYFTNIFRCKKIGEAGSQQLLLDTQAIKGLLLEFPVIGNHGDVVSPSLSSYVSREMAKAEALLKVIGSRPENLADNFNTLLPNAPPSLYQRILDLKVLKRHEQAALTEAISRQRGETTSSQPSSAAAFVTPPPPAAAPSTATANDFAARFRFSSANTAAVAAGEKMREKMAGSLTAMKNLNIGFNRQGNRQ